MTTSAQSTAAKRGWVVFTRDLSSARPACQASFHFGRTYEDVRGRYLWRVPSGGPEPVGHSGRCGPPGGQQPAVAATLIDTPAKLTDRTLDARGQRSHPQR